MLSRAAEINNFNMMDKVSHTYSTDHKLISNALEFCGQGYILFNCVKHVDNRGNTNKFTHAFICSYIVHAIPPPLT